MKLPVMPPVAPMLAKPVAAIPSGQFYEPKWDGFRSIVFRDGDEVEIGSRKERPMTRYFPEVVEAVRRNFPPRAAIDGEIVVAGDGGLDFWALQQRIHPAASRVALLAATTPASFIAFDLLALGDDDLMGEPFEVRRGALEQALANAAPPVHLTPITRDEEVARAWFDRFEGAGLDGVIAKRADLTYEPDKRVMAKIKHVRTADCVVAGYRTHKTAADAIGSLLLGLYIDETAPASQWGDRTSGLAPVGVIGAFPMARRRELFAELQPLVIDVAEHPWSWAAEMGHAPEGGSRWNPKKDLSFVPLRPERVVEVRYDYLEGARFRHPPQFVRWRPDRDPVSCGYAQLAQPTPFDLADALAGRLTSSRGRASRRSVVAVGAPQRRRPDRRRGRANSDAERRALAKASGRRKGPPPRAPRSGYAVLSTDGGSRGNPGPAAIGYVLAAADGTLLATHGETIGVAGANVAEYRALLAGLEHASGLGLDRVDARCDAKLIVEQLAGSREPTNPRLRDLCSAVREVAERIGTVVFTWVPAEANGRAHALVAEALDPRS